MRIDLCIALCGIGMVVVFLYNGGRERVGKSQIEIKDKKGEFIRNETYRSLKVLNYSRFHRIAMCKVHLFIYNSKILYPVWLNKTNPFWSCSYNVAVFDFLDFHVLSLQVLWWLIRILLSLYLKMLLQKIYYQKVMEALGMLDQNTVMI